MAAKHDRGVIVLALTSNPEGASVQRAAAADGRTVAQHIVDAAAADNDGVAPIVTSGSSSAPRGELGVDLSGLGGPILIPASAPRAAPLPIWAGFSAPSRP